MKQLSDPWRKQLSTLGGMAALVLSGLFVAVLLLLAVVLPAQGFGPGTLNDPARGVAFVASSGLPLVLAFISIGTAVVFVPLMLALYDRLRATAVALRQGAVVAGLIASGLFLVYA